MVKEWLNVARFQVPLTDTNTVFGLLARREMRAYEITQITTEGSRDAALTAGAIHSWIVDYSTMIRETGGLFSRFGDVACHQRIFEARESTGLEQSDHTWRIEQSFDRLIVPELYSRITVVSGAALRTHIDVHFRVVSMTRAEYMSLMSHWNHDSDVGEVPIANRATPITGG